MEQRVKSVGRVGLLLVASAALAAGAHAQADGPHMAGPRCPMAAASADAALAPLEPAAQAAVAEALQDERRTEEQYARFVRELGERPPFSQTVHAEARHAEFLEHLLKSRSLAVPAADAPLQTEAAATFKDACAVSIVAEKRNVAIYDRLLAAGPLPDDVKHVFEHNRWVSQEHHLPAFERCSAAADVASTGGCGVGACWRGGGRGPGGGRGCSGGCGRTCGAGAADGRTK